jgi:hypothetical protein
VLFGAWLWLRIPDVMGGNRIVDERRSDWETTFSRLEKCAYVTPFFRGSFSVWRGFWAIFPVRGAESERMVIVVPWVSSDLPYRLLGV